MRVLVTGAAGHLGEALTRILPDHGMDPVGLDVKPSPYVNHVGSIGDRDVLRQAMGDVDAVLHTATLHKPHVATHSKQDFIDTNITGTLVVLEEAVAAGVTKVVLTSSTSAFGTALKPSPGAPAGWINESVVGEPKNIYGVTKTSAEELCALFAKKHGLGCVALRTSRFFPEEDDNEAVREVFSDENVKANEYLYRRVDLEDAAIAHIDALRAMSVPGFAKYIISATAPFTRDHLATLRTDPRAVVASLYPEFETIYGARGYKLFNGIGRVYVNENARTQIGWRPTYDFGKILEQLRDGVPIGSGVARVVGSKRYHEETFEKGPFPVD
jgi:UDP-glucose 4-epimerase